MKQALRVAFGFLILWASVLHAEVRIVIDSGVDSGRPIGVVPFQWAGPGAAPEDIGGIVAADLRNSGKFNPLDRARLPQQPGSAQEVQPAAWSALGIDAVVVGQVTPNPDGSYNVAFYGHVRLFGERIRPGEHNGHRRNFSSGAVQRLLWR